MCLCSFVDNYSASEYSGFGVLLCIFKSSTPKVQTACPWCCCVLFALTLNRYAICGCVILLIVGIVVCTVNCNSQDGIVLNAANFSLYVCYIYRNTAFTLFKAAQRKVLHESGTFSDILSKFSEIQKRASQYLFCISPCFTLAFLFGSAYNIEGFFEEITHDKIFSITLGLIAMISLPLTAQEWPWVETEEK